MVRVAHTYGLAVDFLLVGRREMLVQLQGFSEFTSLSCILVVTLIPRKDCRTVMWID